MYAFMKTANNYLIKAYDHGDDWQVVLVDPNRTTVCERWVSLWKDENHYPGARRASLEKAFSRGCDQAGAEFNADAIHVAA